MKFQPRSMCVEAFKRADRPASGAVEDGGSGSRHILIEAQWRLAGQQDLDIEDNDQLTFATRESLEVFTGQAAEEFRRIHHVRQLHRLHVEYGVDEWTRWLQEELDAGAWKVITEAREGGTAGIFDAGGGMRTELIGEIAQAVGIANVIFEAPSKAAQAWFVKQFGPEVNLGNIPPEEVIPLETLRLGLRGDTLKEILLT